MEKRIALINNDAALLAALAILLRGAGYDPHLFRGVLPTVRDVRALVPQAIVLDIPLTRPAISWQVLALMKVDPLLQPVPLILCSTDACELRELAPALQQNGCHILPKPFEPMELLGVLAQALA